MNGTMTSDTEAILLIPPMVIKPTVITKKIPVTKGGICSVKLAASDMERTCVNVPIPNRATPTPKTAKQRASIFPSVLCFNPFSR